MPRFVPLTFLLLVSLAALAVAGERQYAEYNCAIAPPDDWEDATAVAAEKGVIACFRSPDHTRSVFILVEERSAPLPEMDDSFAEEFDRAAEPQMGKRISGRFIPVQGLRCYERTSAPLLHGKTISMVSRIFLVRSRFYSIQGYQFSGGDAGTDPLIREVVESFRFLTPPPASGFTTPVELPPGPGAPAEAPAAKVPAMRGSPPAPPVNIYITPTDPSPTPATPATATATDSRENDLRQAYQRGQAVGRMLAYVVGAGVAILIIVWLVRRRKRRPARPPVSTPPRRAAGASRPPAVREATRAPAASAPEPRAEPVPAANQGLPSITPSTWEPPAAPLPPVPLPSEALLPMPDMIVASQATLPVEEPVASQPAPPVEASAASFAPPDSSTPAPVESADPVASRRDARTLAGGAPPGSPNTNDISPGGAPQILPPDQNAPDARPLTVLSEPTPPPAAPPAEPSPPPVSISPVAVEPAPSPEPPAAPETLLPPPEPPCAGPAVPEVPVTAEPPAPPVAPPAPPAPPVPSKTATPEKFVIRPRQSPRQRYTEQ